MGRQGMVGVSAAAVGGNVATPAAIRSHFPALERRHGGFPVAYFDGPGGTQVPRAVGDAMKEYLYHHNANTHWEYPSSAETDEALGSARTAFADFVNGTPHEIVFGANMTTLTFHLSRGLGRRLGPGDEIVVTELDHHANIAPWTALETERGVTVRWGRFVPATGQLDLDHVLSLIGNSTRVVAIGAAANSLGTINDVRLIADAAHARGALVFVDGVHYAPHALPDVTGLGCDLFVCSPYKFYGPHIGVLWARRDLLDAIDFPRLAPAPHDAPERAETGTLNHEGIVGAAAGIHWLASLGGQGELRTRLVTVYKAFHSRGAALFQALWEGLAAIPGVRLFGPPPDAPRTPTVGFLVDGVPSSDVTRALAELGLFTSNGDFYAKTVIERLGCAPEGIVRAGCACYTSDDEIARLAEGVRAIATR